MTVHVAGAGLSGLAAALTAAKAGHKVVVHEAAAQAGGRCRSFEDDTVGGVIDNGTHVLLGANGATFNFLRAIGSDEAFLPATPRRLPFIDLETGKSWSFDVIGQGALALMMAAGTNKEMLEIAWRTAVAPARRNASVSEVYAGAGSVYDRLLVPLCTALMNCPPKDTEARAFLRVMKTLALGGRGAIRPFVAPENLAAALINPANATIQRFGGEVRFHDPLLGIEPHDGKITAARYRSDSVTLCTRDAPLPFFSRAPSSVPIMRPRQARNFRKVPG